MNLRATNVWWIPTPSIAVQQSHKTFKSEIRDFLEHVSMHCYSKLVEPFRPRSERLMWTVVHLMAFISLGILLHFNWQQSYTKPLSTNLHSTLYPVENIAFPAVSICSNNRLSKSAALEYATYLSSLDPYNRSNDYFLYNIRNFSALYEADITYLKEITEFQEFLDKYDTNASNLHYDTRRRMKLMTPPCTQLLLKCSTAGKLVPCLSPGMFQMSITHRGFCCLFNVNETESLISFENKYSGKYRRHSGIDMGFSVLLNASSDDLFYQIFELYGFIVHIYDPFKYDDMTSGVVAESFITNATESFIRVYPQAMISDDEIRSYPHSIVVKPFLKYMQIILVDPFQRQCSFPDEYPEKYGTRYSMSNCITNCRIRSIARLCRCIPFYMPASYLVREAQLPYCNLHHVLCLNKFQTKWFTVITKRSDNPELESDLENSLDCPECLPACSYVRYKISLSVLPLRRYQLRATGIMSGVKNMSDIALLHVFFAQPTLWLFKQSISNSWYQVLSNIGGLCGIVTGFSLATLCEFTYFILQQIYRSLRKFSSKTEQSKTSLIIYP